MKKSRDFESSLELLLDTMCNSFGGVMFIAISLIIVLTMTRKADVSQSENFKNLEEMQTRLEELKKEFKEIENNTADINNMVEQLKNDPRRKYLADIVKIEALTQKLTAENELLNVELKVQTRKNQELDDKKEQIQKKADDKKIQLQQLIDENIKLDERLNNLRDDLKRTTAGRITFKTMSVSQKIPYFLIVNDGKIWRVGPEKLNGEPHSDVEYTKDGDNIVCEIKDVSAGVPLLDGENISAAAHQLLNGLPAGRFPEFSIHSNSMRDFCTFREELKKNNVTHSVNTFFESFDKKFIYTYTRKKENYEAY